MIPSRANRYACWPVTSSPRKSSRPDVGLSRPEHTRAMVVLPAPFDPSRATALPAGTSSETPKTARNGP